MLILLIRNQIKTLELNLLKINRKGTTFPTFFYCLRESKRPINNEAIFREVFSLHDENILLRREPPSNNGR